LPLAACLAAPAVGRPAHAADPANVPITAEAAKLPSADDVMAGLLARLPSKPIVVTGDLVTSTNSGGKSRLGIAILLCYPRQATYTIQDAFGRPLERLTVTRDKQNVSRTYERGDPAVGAPTPSLGTRIQNTALSWSDLTLDFLWWQGGAVIGREETRGQPCYVLDRHAPRDPNSPYASVRMWVDTRVSMLLQADGFDKLGDRSRRLSVKSFKKIKDEWMIKDLEIVDDPAGLTTVLRVRDVQPAETPATARE
jgi:hypothetical protein